MIETIEGRGVGAGKSYYVTTRVLKFLSEGGIVYASTTYEFLFDEAKKLIEDRFGVIIVPEQFNSFDKNEAWRLHEITPPGTDEKPVLLIIDEAHTAFNNRDWADKTKRPFFDWLTQSRHDNNDVIFISQSANNMDKQIARLVTYIVRVRNMMNFEVPGLGKVPFLCGKSFMVSRFDTDGKTLFRKDRIKQDQAIFKCYRSKSCGGSHKRMQNITAPFQLQRVKKKNPKMIKIIMAGIAAMGLFGAYHLYGAFTKEKPAAKITAKEESKSKEKAKAVTVDPVFISEGFRFFTDARRIYHNGPAKLITDAGTYITGEASPYGMVEAVHSPDLGKSYAIAKCRTATSLTIVVALEPSQMAKRGNVNMTKGPEKIPLDKVN